MKLTPTQKIAVEAGGRNILVAAGAGTGKTRVLVERFLHLVVSGQALVTEILALTFTDKAANEMKSRILTALSRLGLQAPRRDLESAYISTIHAFAARVLREHPLEAQVAPDFKVIESDESDFLQEQALEETLELHCQKGSEIFELIRVYEETKIRDGLKAVLKTARHEGKCLKDFFSGEKFSPMPVSAVRLFEKLGETELAFEWKRFEKIQVWDWALVEEFRAWRETFSRRKGNKGQSALWQEIRKTVCPVFLAQKIEHFMKPWAEKFETLALLFEELYARKKEEGGFLDFDDLQMRTVRLFKKENPVCQKLRKRYREKFREILVDEFQDTNYLQLELLELLSRGDNLFSVGDFKQSIYGFRGAEPRLFLEKEKLYQDSERGLRIPLLENFRTAKPVLGFINSFFEELWREDQLPFEGLLARAEEPKDIVPGTELLSVTLEEGESLARARMREADQIAERILELRQEGIAYGDMAVLFQAMTSSGIYEQAFKKSGIPYFVITGRGFYHQPEIRDMVSFLAFLENPLADIPLAAVLRSPLFQIRDNTLFWMAHHVKHQAKSKAESSPLYEAVKKVEEIRQIPKDETEKVLFFRRMTDEMLLIKDRVKLTELLDFILEKTSYELTVLADPQGVRRYANLKKIVNLAREFEGIEPLSLGAFLRKIRRLSAEEVRESEAQIEAETSGHVVRLLSVHKSKGLEFPVVFVADLGRGRSSKDSTRIVSEIGMGYALKVWNEKRLDWEEPWSWQAIDECSKRKEKGEWKRLFYVAATRAKHRLILSGVCRGKDTEKENFSDRSSWMDWVTAMPPECLRGVLIREAGTGKPQKPLRCLAEKEDLPAIFQNFEPRPFRGRGKTKHAREEIEKESAEILNGIRETPKVTARSVDLPVSAYALYEKSPEEYRRIYEIGYADAGPESGVFPPEGGEGGSAADFGTQVHRILERIDFRNFEGSLAGDFSCGAAGMDSPQRSEAEKIIRRFCQSPLCRKLKKAKKLYRELPFVLQERHGRIYGVIDLLFQDEKNQWHIVDYKTAVGDPGKVRSAGYETQVMIYALAFERISGGVPNSARVYFLKNQWEYPVRLDRGKLLAFEKKLGRMQEEILCLNPIPK